MSDRLPQQIISRGVTERTKFVSQLVAIYVCLRNSRVLGRDYSNINPTRCNVTQFNLPGNCSTCFGWYHHPSSGAQTTIYIVCVVGGIRHPQHTQTISNCSTIAVDSSNGVTNTRIRHPQHTQTGSNSFTIATDSSNGVTNSTCCRYSRLRSWWWVAVPPETCRAVSR